MFLLSYFLANFKTTKILYYSFGKQPQIFLSSTLVMMPYLISLQGANSLYLSTKSSFFIKSTHGIIANYLHFIFFKQKMYYLFKLFKFLYIFYKDVLYYRYLFYYFLTAVQPGFLAKLNVFNLSRFFFFNNVVIFKKKYRRPTELFILNKPALLQIVKFSFLHKTCLKLFFFFFFSLKFKFLFSNSIIEKFIKPIFFCNFSLLYLLFFFPQKFKTHQKLLAADYGLSFYILS